MKILYLLYSFTVGGTEKLVSEICNEMEIKDQQVYLYIVNDLVSEDLLSMLDKRVSVELQRRPVKGGKKVETIFKIANYVRKNRIDIVHCNSFNSPELLILSIFINPKVKIVYTIHDVGQYKTLSWLRKIYRNWGCDSFVAISESVKKDIIAFGAVANKVSVVYNAINLNKFDIREKKKFDKNHIIIGNVARINSLKKGQDVLIRAIAKLKDKYNIDCYFAGAADDAHQNDLKALENMTRELKLSNAIHFLGNVDDIPKFLSKLDIFVLPSRYEGFGISLIEAMAMGIPCIATDLDGPSEIIGNEERGYLFKINDANNLADKLQLVIENYLCITCEENIAYVCCTFNIKNMCKKLMEIYLA